jgi:hypothetical protein
MSAVPVFDEALARRQFVTVHDQGNRLAVNRQSFCFDAFSSREPAAAPLENVI